MALAGTIAKNITANYFGIIGQIVIAFFLSPFLVHTLGDTQYGIWTVIAALGGYMSLLDLGISSALTRYVAKYYQEKDYESINTILSSSLFLFVVISAAIVLVSPAIAELMVNTLNFEEEFKDTIHLLVIIVAFDVALLVISGVYRGALAGFQRFDIINIVRLGALLFQAFILFQFLTYERGLIMMGGVIVLVNLLVVGFYYYLLQRYYPFLSYKVSYIEKKQIRSVFDFSKFVFVAMLANQLLSYSSSFIIGLFMNAAAIAYYSIPWTLAEYIKQLCFAMSRTYIPAFSELDSAGESESVYRLYLSGTRLIMVLSNLLCVGMLVYGEPFILLWIGERYALEAAPLLFPLLIVIYFFASQLIGLSLLQGTSRHQRYSIWNVWVSLLSIGLSVFLVTRYGLLGVAVGAAIPQVIYFGFIIPVYVCRLLGWSVIRYYAATHLSLLLPSFVLYGTLSALKYAHYPDSYILLLSQAIIATVVYMAIVYLFMLNQKEKDMIGRFAGALFRKIRKS
jgi:O-antigen/teichoic acid export membrane protein